MPAVKCEKCSFCCSSPSRAVVLCTLCCGRARQAPKSRELKENRSWRGRKGTVGPQVPFWSLGSLGKQSQLSRGAWAHTVTLIGHPMALGSLGVSRIIKTF